MSAWLFYLPAVTRSVTTPLLVVRRGGGIDSFNWLVAGGCPEYHLCLERLEGKDGEGEGGRRFVSPLLSGQAEAVGIACLTIKGLSSAADWRLPWASVSPARLPSLFEARGSSSWLALLATRLCNPNLGVFVGVPGVFYLGSKGCSPFPPLFETPSPIPFFFLSICSSLLLPAGLRFSSRE